MLARVPAYMARCPGCGDAGAGPEKAIIPATLRIGPGAPRDHPGQGGTGQHCRRQNLYLDQLARLVGGEVWQGHVVSHAALLTSIVNGRLEQSSATVSMPLSVERSAAATSIVDRGQRFSETLEPITPPADDDEVESVRGQSLGECPADTRGRSCNECERGHGGYSFLAWLRVGWSTQKRAGSCVRGRGRFPRQRAPGARRRGHIGHRPGSGPCQRRRARRASRGSDVSAPGAARLRS